MSKEMVISAAPHETRVAILEDGQLFEIYVERQKEFALVGSIYKGRVTRVLPGMQSAFVEIGLDTDAFLYVSDFLEDLEEFDNIVHNVEDKVQRIEEQGGEVVSAVEVEQGAALEPTDVESAISATDYPVAPDLHAQPVAAVNPSSVPTQAPRPRPMERDRNRGGFGRRSRFGRQSRRGQRRDHEIPPSKFASNRAPEPPLENHEAIILPGESLAKYRDRSASNLPRDLTGAQEGSGFIASESTQESQNPVTLEAAPAEQVAPVVEPRVERAPRFQQSSHANPPTENTARFQQSSHLDPLPGESIARARHTVLHEEPAADSVIPPSRGIVDEPVVHAEDRMESLKETFAVDPVSGTSSREAIFEAERGRVGEEETFAERLEIEESRASEELEGNFAAHDLSADRQESAAAEYEDRGNFTEPMSSPDLSGEMDSAEAAVDLGELQHEDDAQRSDEATLPSDADGNNSAQQPDQPRENSQARVRSDFRARMNNPARRGRRDNRGRNQRDHRDHPPRHGGAQPQRRVQLISELLKAGQEIIVQIAKEPLGKKGARITSHVALPGRYLVYMPTLHHTGVSRKISTAEERARLRQLVSEAQKGGGGGFIVRTAASQTSPDEVRADVEFLMRTWAEIKARSEQRHAPSLLHRDLNLVERLLRDNLSDEFSTIWVDSEEEYTKVVDFVSRFQPQLLNRVRLYVKETPVFEEFGIQQEIDKALRPKVWLKSGGHIVINHTEALVAIDVNTGKFVGRGSTRLEDTIVKTNLEAVKEIVRQIRLRDLGGIIVIDFIDMEERRNREKVMAALEEALRTDRAPSKVLRFNEFGLVAITRKRTKQALERTLCQPCPYCTGSGMVKSIPTLCYEIQTEARKMAPEMDSASITLRVHPEISKALKTRESALVEELEHWTKKHVIIQADPTLHWEQYDIY
jgi:ribonuclease G